MKLMRFWFECEKGLGVGVTAFTFADAVTLIQNEPLAMLNKPNFKQFIVDVDISGLDKGHVIPNMGVCSNRGVWFPNSGATLRS